MKNQSIIGHRRMSVSGRTIRQGIEGEPMVLMQIEDMTEKSYQGDKL